MNAIFNVNMGDKHSNILNPGWGSVWFSLLLLAQALAWNWAGAYKHLCHEHEDDDNDTDNDIGQVPRIFIMLSMKIENHW